MKYTSGPWTIKPLEEPYSDIIISSAKRNIAKIWQDDAPVHDYNNEQQANAKLMAAAPDLLRALENITDQLERVGDSRKDKPWIDEARAAITKATDGD